MCPQAKMRGLLLRTRGEMAIIAALFTLTHNIAYGQYYFVKLFTNISELDTVRIFAAVLSLIMIILLIPLTITSFMVIRRKMNPIVVYAHSIDIQHIYIERALGYTY